MTKPIPVRLPEDLIARLDVAAKKIGSNRAAVIRFCADSWLNHFEQRGVVSLPPDWEDILAQYDGRRVFPPPRHPFRERGEPVVATERASSGRALRAATALAAAKGGEIARAPKLALKRKAASPSGSSGKRRGGA